jgi:hypothetical protein
MFGGFDLKGIARPVTLYEAVRDSVFFLPGRLARSLRGAALAGAPVAGAGAAGALVSVRAAYPGPR